MKGNLYSRKKIRLPNIGELKSIKAIILILFGSIIFTIIIFLHSAYPVFKASCETVASSKGVSIINNEVDNVMKNISYDNLISIEKDNNGKISLVKADSVKINSIVSMIISNIQKEFDNIPRINVFINMGSVSGISVLKKWEPRFEVELESAGTINANVKTEFKALGINQTYHKIYLQIDSKVGILTPFDTFSQEIKTDVLLTESVIIGEVPSSYYNLEDMENLKEMVNFRE